MPCARCGAWSDKPSWIPAPWICEGEEGEVKSECRFSKTDECPCLLLETTSNIQLPGLQDRTYHEQIVDSGDLFCVCVCVCFGPVVPVVLSPPRLSIQGRARTDGGQIHGKAIAAGMV